MRFILCVDDEPIRYRKLRQLCLEKNIMVVHTCRIEDVVQYLDPIAGKCVGVCLDHDMPMLLPGHSVAKADGRYFARYFFSERNIPVVIASHNEKMATEMEYILQEYATPCVRCPAGSTNFEKVCMELFEL